MTQPPCQLHIVNTSGTRAFFLHLSVYTQVQAALTSSLSVYKIFLTSLSPPITFSTLQSEICKIESSQVNHPTPEYSHEVSTLLLLPRYEPRCPEKWVCVLCGMWGGGFSLPRKQSTSLLIFRCWPLGLLCPLLRCQWWG